MPTPTSYVIPVSNGLLSHRKRIGNAVWVFLWFIDRVTQETESSEGAGECDGLVYSGAPIAARKIADDLGENPRTIQAHIDRLCSKGYVKRIAHGPGEAFGYAVRKSKKWQKTRALALPETPAEKLHTPARKLQGCAEKQQTPAENLRANKEDNTKQNKTGDRPSDASTFNAEPYVNAIRRSWPGVKNESEALEAQILEAFAHEAALQNTTLREAAEHVSGRVAAIAAVVAGSSESKFWTLPRLFREKAYRTPDETWRNVVGTSKAPIPAYLPSRNALDELRAQQGGRQ